MRIYLDHNATTPLCPEARAALLAALDAFGNPSSVHAEGRAARQVVESARAHVASLIGGATDEIVFTSGGTEADSLGIVGLARLARERGQPPRVVAADVEHPAVQGTCEALTTEGFERCRVRVDACGRIDLDHLRALCRPGAAVLAVSLANHELGTMQDIAGVVAVARECGALVHCDAVQAAGKVELSAAALGVDSLAVSAHKFHGPKGVGALWVRRTLDLAPLLPAGHQERERRPGTENVPGIAGMGAAAAVARAAVDDEAPRVAALAGLLERGLTTIPGARIHAAAAPRVGNTVSVGFAGALGESVVAALDLAGFAASTGAACTSGSVAPSPVLLAIGQRPEQAREAVRLSLGRGTTENGVHALLEVLPDIVARAREFR